MSQDHFYNSWPLGALPKHFQRNEPYLIRELGYDWSDARDIISIFEKKIAAYAGSKYAIAVDCCSNGIFLCMKYLNARGEITIPKRTYASIPMQILHAGCSVKFDETSWSGLYQLKPYPIYDSATRFTKGMYIGNNSFQVLSFQIKKRLPIGRGGMILTDSMEAYQWLKLASYDGRDLSVPSPDPNHINILGWHYYMTPEDAARGILLMDQLPIFNNDTGGDLNYTDLSKIKLFYN